MGIIRILVSLLNNPRVIEKLAESRVIRRAAQITAYALTKAQIAARDASEGFLDASKARQVQDEAGRDQGDGGQVGPRLRRLRQTFVKELKAGLRDASKQIKN